MPDHHRVSLEIHKGTWTARENYNGDTGTGTTPVEAAMDLANRLADQVAHLSAYIEGKAVPQGVLPVEKRGDPDRVRGQYRDGQ